jgi:hypothetical protein
MSTDYEALFRQRQGRYIKAMRNEMPDCVPIRPFVAEFTARYAGYTAQEVAHDYQRAFDAAIKCASDFDWDAVVPNMVYVWTGLAHSMGLKYYAIPGVDIPKDTGFQYREPPHEDAFMKADEYDELIDDPTAFLYNKWLPRVAARIVPEGRPVTYEHNVALIRTAMAMFQYFGGFGPQVQRLQSETGTAPAIAGILKAPMDIIADKLRGYLGLVEDIFERPEKLLAASEALAPHLFHVAKTTSDPNHMAPASIWMHRGGVPFVSFDIFQNIYWASLKPVIEELWANGIQTLFYAEGNWDPHLESFRELPEQSIIYHVDQGDIFKCREVLGDRFCLSGGIPNAMLGVKQPEDVRAYVKKVIEGVAQDGGYILDASAIVQNDATVENVRAMTEAGREYGVYSRGHAEDSTKEPPPAPKPEDAKVGAYLKEPPAGKKQRGVCVPWEEERANLREDIGDEEVVRNTWEGIDGLGNMFIWQMLLSF